jgi:hypothetical protein
MSNLEHTFQKQIQHLSLRISKLQDISKQYSYLRLIHVLIGIPLIWAGFQFAGSWAGRVILAVVVAAFLIVLYRHGRLKDSISRHRILSDLKSAQIARMRLDWERMPPVSVMPAQVEHPFGIDLDITGECSLHRLVDTTVSIEGSSKVWSWLMTTEPGLEGILKRQKLVKELSPLVLFRDKLVVNALKARETPHARLDTKSILQWLQKPAHSLWAGRALLPLTLLAGCNLLIFGLGLSVMGMIPWYFFATFLLYLAVMLLLQIEIGKAFRDATSLELTLDRLHAVFLHLEKFGYAHTPNLAKLCAPFLDPQDRPSTQLRRISRIVSAISVRSNPMVWLLLNGVLPWDIYFVRRLDRCREEILALLPAWLDVFTEVEALSSLANFALLNPDYSFPEVETLASRGAAVHNEPRERSEGAGVTPYMRFSAEHLGHPLIPHQKRTCNSFCLDEQNRIALISGSNMSGKSSFLRTLGVNLCLAYAGGPVCAVCLHTGLFRVFACMRINDSLTDGFSFFYAEVKRMKMLLSTTVEPGQGHPVFFLLDEIFRGTNNQERFIGSRAYIRAMAEHPAIGAIATHDLELVKLADENQAITNYHFREDVEEGRMLFDYKLRSGPCPTTNALKIMAMAGLPV